MKVFRHASSDMKVTSVLNPMGRSTPLAKPMKLKAGKLYAIGYEKDGTPVLRRATLRERFKAWAARL